MDLVEEGRRVEGTLDDRLQLLNSYRPCFVNALLNQARHLACFPIEGVSVVYFLRLRSGQLYVGCSTDLEQRLADHASGQACRTTRLDSPVAFLRIEMYHTFSRARHREAQLKRWSRAKKEALIRGDADALHELSLSRE